MDQLQHLHDFLIGAAMQRPPQGADAQPRWTQNIFALLLPTSRTVEVLQFCSWSACRISKKVSAPAPRLIHTVFSAGTAKEHVEKLAQSAQRVLRIHKRWPIDLLIGKRRDGRQLRQAVRSSSPSDCRPFDSSGFG